MNFPTKVNLFVGVAKIGCKNLQGEKKSVTLYEDKCVDRRLIEQYGKTTSG